MNMSEKEKKYYDVLANFNQKIISNRDMLLAMTLKDLIYG
jgi:hypothetical protein